jgi:hypothetical protein
VSGTARLPIRDPLPPAAEAFEHAAEGFDGRFGPWQSVAAQRRAAGEPRFQGAFSNFAALNCVHDLAPVARGLAGLLAEGAPALLVLFGTAPPGEVVVQVLRGHPKAGFRRLARGEVAARLGGHAFTVRYHRRRELARAFAPWFTLRRRRGIGVFVPPSDAEPWISGHPRLLRLLEALDRPAAAPLAVLGDHVLYHLVRTAVPAPGGAP